LVLTLRKFLSLLISIAYFNNPFNVIHWMGTAVVFIGTMLFADFFSSVSYKLNYKLDKVAYKVE